MSIRQILPLIHLNVATVNPTNNLQFATLTASELSMYYTKTYYIFQNKQEKLATIFSTHAKFQPTVLLGCAWCSSLC